MKGVCWLFLLLTAISAVQPAFHRVSSKSGRQSLSDRVNQLTEMTSRHSLLRFNAKNFNNFVRGQPRNYSILVMFTALHDRRDCALCKAMHAEYKMVADSYRLAPTNPDKLFFAVLDVDEAESIFKRLGIATGPVLTHFPATGQPELTDSMDISRRGYAAETIAKWIAKRTEVAIRVVQPVNFMYYFNIIITIIFVITTVYRRRDNLEVFCNTTYWGVVAVGFCCVLTSGQMWNYIRGTPYFVRNEAGLAFVTGSHNGQFVVETLIVMLLNAVIVLGMVLMTEAADSKRDVKKRNNMALIGIVLFVLFFSVLLGIFRLKVPNYPFGLFISFN